MIGIINYGLGNIKAFTTIYKNANKPYKLISNTADFKDVTHIILPGVGAFDHAMQSFNASGLREKTEELVLEKKLPVLGICVGMQMMGNSSEEGEEKGLGWIDADIEKFNTQNNLAVPHMGWNQIILKQESSISKKLNNLSEFYFLHSYYLKPQNNEITLATADYGGEFATIVAKDNIFGIQCHPEKSHASGVQFLVNFSEQ